MERIIQIATSSPSPNLVALARISPLLAAYRCFISAYFNLQKEYVQMAQEIDDLGVEVTETVGIMNSAKVLIDGIGARVQAAVDAALAANPGVDLSSLVQLKQELDTSSQALAAAVAANP
jgi:hypothetical protein